jgi:hypothetical protein
MFYTYRKYFIEIFALSIFVMKDVCANSADYPTYWISGHPFKPSGGGAIKLINEGSTVNISLYANRGSPSFDQNSISVNLSLTKKMASIRHAINIFTRTEANAI